MKTTAWALTAASMAGLLWAGVAQAETVLEANQAANWPARQVTSRVENDGSTVFVLKARSQAIGLQKFEVDPDATYTLSGEFRSSSDVEVKPIYFGFRPIDEKGRGILPQHVNIVAGTQLTELAADAKKGDTKLRLKDASSWKNDQSYSLVAFDAREDLSDLPNAVNSTTIEKGSITKLDDGTYELTLTKPLTLDRPAGTVVRQHASGGTYHYTAAGGRAIKGEWTTLSGKIKGIQASGLLNTQWRRGTKQAQIIILHNGKQDQSNLEFRNIKVEKD